MPCDYDFGDDSEDGPERYGFDSAMTSQISKHISFSGKNWEILNLRGMFFDQIIDISEVMTRREELVTTDLGNAFQEECILRADSFSIPTSGQCTWISSRLAIPSMT